jgi:hypothetical protein
MTSSDSSSNAITDEDQRAHFEQLGFLLSVGEKLSQLGMAGPTGDAGHEFGEVIGIGGPARKPALIDVAIVGQLHLKSAGTSNLTEHLSLELAGGVQGRLPAMGSIESEDDASAAASSAARSKLLDLSKEAIEL